MHILSPDTKVIFSGWIDNKEMLDKYQSADIFVLPSPDEGMPNAVLEVMAARLPDVLKDEGMIIDGHNGFLVPPKDASMLSEKNSLLLEDINLRTEMGQKSIQLVSNKYKWEDISFEYYKQLLSIRKDCGKCGSASMCFPASPS